MAGSRGRGRQSVAVAGAGVTANKRKRETKSKYDSAVEADSSGSGEVSKQISAQEEDDLSSALIAQLLAEDAAATDSNGNGGIGQYMSYYDDYSGNGTGNGGDALDDYATNSEGDDDWDPNSKGRKTSKNNGKSCRKQQTTSAVKGIRSCSQSSSDSEQGVGNSGKKSKKPRTTASTKRAPDGAEPSKYRSGAYTPEEEAKFNEALELYGRSWSQISDHVETRDSKSIRSHAQKYFIKLFRDQQPLPDKVRESGEGYTLSGKPLDPNSAAARPYLQRVMELEPPVPKPVKEEADPAKQDDKEEHSAPNNDSTERPETEKPNDKAQTPPPPPTTSSTSQTLPKSPERTAYAKGRPQRSQVRSVKLNYQDPHQMVRCTPFAGQPLSGVSGCQPFKIGAHTNAQLQMDFHAHLMLTEVIGFLGGKWDAETKSITVVRAFPCAALESEDAHTNVEMDPDSELIVRHQILDAGLRVVGWYHSHPTFRPDPSIIDIENQTSYQKLFRDCESAEEPFVGAIVGPYDPALPGPVSAINWFYVGKTVVDQGCPKRLVVETVRDNCLPVEEQDILLKLLKEANCHKDRAVLKEVWRSSSSSTELRSLKMAVSLAHRMPWILVPDCSGSVADMPCGEADKNCQTGALNAVDKMVIPESYLLAGQRATQDPLIVAFGQQFTTGVLKAQTNGDRGLADTSALERVFAAYFLQWGTNGS